MAEHIFQTQQLAEHSRNEARVTRITTPHGSLLTPAFMPVGTRACVNFMDRADLERSGSQIILGGNTYHMLLAPGMERLKEVGGMHRFMNWPHPMLTDSGGFQVFSLAKNQQLCRTDSNGAYFTHPNTGKSIHLTPKTAIESQQIIGADIIMAFDQCTPDDADRAHVITLMERTHRWLLESIATFKRHPYAYSGHRQALFGIIQGGNDRQLREQSAEFVTHCDCDGIAVGGASIGFDMEKTRTILSWLAPLLPKEKTRYSMGVGLSPQDLLDVVALGMDIFDCVAPTRNARHGALYTGQVVAHNGWLRIDSPDARDRLLIKKPCFATDERPIQEGCTCSTCQQHSRAFLHYLFKQKSPLYANYACNHNIHFMQHVCAVMRETITADASLHNSPVNAAG